MSKNKQNETKAPAQTTVDVNKALAALGKVKDSDFQEVKVNRSTDWNPTKGDSLTGVYLGNEKNGNRIIHGIAVQGDNGPVEKHFTGSRSLTAALTQVPAGSLVRIVCEGREEGERSNKFKLYRVGA